MKLFTLLFITLLVSPIKLYAQVGSLTEGSFIHNELTRGYSVYIPEGYSADKEWPLILNFHGYSGDVPDHINRTKMHDLADEKGFIIVYPVGLTITRDPNILPSFVPATGAGWSVPGFSSERNEIAFTDALLNEIFSNYSIDQERVHATGLSLGGYMAAYVGTQMPDKIASFASVAGHMTDDVIAMLNEETQKSALLIHGTNDPITSYNDIGKGYPSVESIANRLASNNNCNSVAEETELENLSSNDNTTVTLFNYGNCDAGYNVKLYRVNGGGHRWPGSGITTPAGLGYNSLDISTSELVFDFFEKNPMPQSKSCAIEGESEIPAEFKCSVVSVLEEMTSEQGGVPGAVATIHFDGINWTTFAGVKDEQSTEINPSDRFMYRSLTKFQTAAIIIQLHEEELINIDGELGDYIESINNIPDETTLRELLSMTANTCNFLTNDLVTFRSQNSNHYFDSTRDVLSTYLVDSNCNASNDYQSNDSNYEALGLVIEAITDNVGSAAFENRIYSPLGLSSALLAPKGANADSSNGAWFLVNGNPIDLTYNGSNSYLSSQRYSAGSVMNTEDAMNLLVKLFEGEMIMGESMVEMANPSEVSIGAFEGFLGYGLGLVKLDIGGQTWYGHSGSGGNSSMTYYDPHSKMGFSVAGNLGDFQKVADYAGQVANLVSGCVSSEACKSGEINVSAYISNPVSGDVSSISDQGFNLNVELFGAIASQEFVYANDFKAFDDDSIEFNILDFTDSLLSVTIEWDYSESEYLVAKALYVDIKTTQVESNGSTPNRIFLSQNYPNPFNPTTNISFELPQSSLVQLKVYNLMGQEVANLVDGRMNSGNHTVNFDASQLSSGVYIYRLVAGNQSMTRKMMLIK